MIAFSKEDWDAFEAFVNGKIKEEENKMNEAPRITDCDHYYLEGYSQAFLDVANFISDCTMKSSEWLRGKE